MTVIAYRRLCLTLAGVLGLVLGSSLVFAQKPLTDLEQKSVETLALKAQLAAAYKQIADLQAAFGACQGQLGPAQLEQNSKALDAERAALKTAIEQARPGFTWDPATGAFTKKSGGS